MVNNLTDAETKQAAKFIEATAVPAIKKIIDVVNEQLAPLGICAGVELQWFFDKVEGGSTDASEKKL